MSTRKMARVRSKQPPRGMNKLEESFANWLECRRLTGDIESWEFECHKLRLGNNCWYTPDFRVIAEGGFVQYYEVKGFWRDDARAKLVAAADRYSRERFFAVTRKHHEWEFEAIQPQ